MQYILYVIALLVFLTWIGGRQKPIHTRPEILRKMGQELYPLLIIAFAIAMLGYWVSPSNNKNISKSTSTQISQSSPASTQSTSPTYKKVFAYGFGAVEIPSSFNVEEIALLNMPFYKAKSKQQDNVEINFGVMNFPNRERFHDFLQNPNWSINSPELELFISIEANSLKISAEVYTAGTRADLSQVKMYSPKTSQIQGIRSLTMAGKGIGRQGITTYYEVYYIPHNNSILKISLTCPEADVAKWKPVFDRVLSTMVLDRR